MATEADMQTAPLIIAFILAFHETLTCLSASAHLAAVNRRKNPPVGDHDANADVVAGVDQGGDQRVQAATDQSVPDVVGPLIKLAFATYA